MTNATLLYKTLVDRTLRFLGLACIAGMSFALQAETRTFVGSAGGAWGTAANWNPSGVPAATDTAVVPADMSVRVTSTDLAKFLAVTDVSLSGTVELLDVTATLTETHLSGTGTFRALGSDFKGTVLHGGEPVKKRIHPGHIIYRVGKRGFVLFLR